MPLNLGTITLDGIELPSRMPFGGQQRLAVHRLPGGGRVVDAMGSDDRDANWSGTLMGPLAVSRARQLDAMRIAGATVTLAWADFRRSCIISSFEPDYGSAGAVIPYSITVCLLPDPTPAAQPTDSSAAGTALGSLQLTDATLVAAALAVSTAVSAFGAFTAGTSAQSAAASSAAALSAAAAARAGVANSGLNAAALSTVSNAAGFSGVLGSAGSAAALAAQASSAAAQAGLVSGLLAGGV